MGQDGRTGRALRWPRAGEPMGGTPVRVECVSELVNTNASLCLVTQLCLTLCDPMDYSLQGSYVHASYLACYCASVSPSVKGFVSSDGWVSYLIQVKGGSPGSPTGEVERSGGLLSATQWGDGVPSGEPRDPSSVPPLSHPPPRASASGGNPQERRSTARATFLCMKWMAKTTR